jgi:hypothetical protein
VESVLNAFEELEQSLTVNHAQESVDCDSLSEVECPNSTQQLLDEMLGRFEDDDSTTPLACALLAYFADSDE